MYAEEPECSGVVPAALIGWVMPVGAAPVVSIYRNGGFIDAVDTAVSGNVYPLELAAGLGGADSIVVEASVSGSSVFSAPIVVANLLSECGFQPGPGERPHRAIVWADPPSCVGGQPTVQVHWTPVLGASSYTLQRVPVHGPGMTVTGLTGNTYVDSGLVPGDGVTYSLTAKGEGGDRPTRDFGVIVPGRICGSSGGLGPFFGAMSAPSCYPDTQGTRGAVTFTWTSASGAKSVYRTYDFVDHHLEGASSSDSDFSDRYSAPYYLGHVVRAVAQAESATVPGSFRETQIVGQAIPMGVCAGAFAPPTAQTFGPPYVYADDHSVVLRGEIGPHGADVTARFLWGTSDDYGQATETRAIAASFNFPSISEILTGLACGTAIHYQLAVTSGYGTVYGGDQVVTTDPCPLIFSDGFESGSATRWVSP